MGRPIGASRKGADPRPAASERLSTSIDKTPELVCASRVGLTPSPTCQPGQGGSRKGMRPFGNETGRARLSALLGKPTEGFLCQKRKPRRSGVIFFCGQTYTEYLN